MTTAGGTGTELMTLSDVAVLAGVRRPVISMWRKRPCAAGPFPPAATQAGGVELFARSAVVAWLVASGRGNNRQVADDAALHVRPPIPTAAGLRLASALAVLRTLSGEHLAGLDPHDLADLADEHDPDDQMLADEITSAEPADLEAMAGYVDALVDASYGPADALGHLDPSRFGVPPEEAAPSEGVRRLVADVTSALATPLRADGPCRLVDPTGCAADLVLAVTGPDGDGWLDPLSLRPAAVADPPERAAAIRGAWRTLTAHTGAPDPTRVDADGHIDVDGPAVLVCRYPHPGARQPSTLAVLDAIDDIAVQLRPQQRLVVLGPAAVLTDSLAEPAARRLRHEILSTGRLRALVRLGRASTPAAVQRRLALWVLGPEPSVGYRARGRTAVADLAGHRLDEVSGDLVADVVAAIEDRSVDDVGGRPTDTEGRAHVFRVARYQPTHAVLARQGDLVPRDLRPAGRSVITTSSGASPTSPGALCAASSDASPGALSGEAAGSLFREAVGSLFREGAGSLSGEGAGSLLGEAVALAASVRRPLPGPALAVRPLAAEGQAESETARGARSGVRELLDRGRLRLLAGTRLVPGEVHEETGPAGAPAGVTVVGLPELSGQRLVGSRRVDLLAFTAAHSRAARTEAGDVIFYAGRPGGAWVDPRGGTVVEAPARALRIVSASDRPLRLLPHVLAADLRAAPTGEWRALTARLVPAAVADPLADVLAAAASAREQAFARADDLTRLTDLLADGAVVGEFTTMLDTTEEGR